MTKLRQGEPWRPAAEYGRSLSGLTVNLIVRDIGASLPFYGEVVGLRVLYSDPDFAALEGPNEMRITLHADHAYDGMPWAPRLQAGEPRGLGAEIRLLGLDPDAAERRARERGVKVLLPTRDWPHGWRDCLLEDPDGYVLAVGIPTKP